MFIVQSSQLCNRVIARVYPVHAVNAEQRQTTADLWTKPTVLSRRSACRQHVTTSTITIYYYSAQSAKEVPAHKELRNCISLALGRLPDLSGSVVLVVHVAGGSTSSEEITVSYPPTYGDRLSTAVTVEERRNDLRTMRLPDLT